jgi:hypothetical protein
MEENCHVLANSHWEILFKAVGQPLGFAKRQRWADRYFGLLVRCPLPSGLPK